MSGIEREKEEQGEKKATWKPAAARKAEKLATAAAGKYDTYAKRSEKDKDGGGGAGALRAEVFKKKTLEPVFSKREDESNKRESKHPIAHELAHVVQQSKARPAAELKYLKYPSSKAEPEVKPRDEKAAKKVIVADRKKRLSAPADSDTLAALADKLFEKLSAEAELERDVTGAD